MADFLSYKLNTKRRVYQTIRKITLRENSKQYKTSADAVIHQRKLTA